MNIPEVPRDGHRAPELVSARALVLPGTTTTGTIPAGTASNITVTHNFGHANQVYVTVRLASDVAPASWHLKSIGTNSFMLRILNNSASDHDFSLDYLVVSTL